METIKITQAPAEYHAQSCHLSDFQVLEWSRANPVIALRGQRTCIAPHNGWKWEYSASPISPS